MESSFGNRIRCPFSCFDTDVPDAVQSVNYIVEGCVVLLQWKPPQNTGCPIKGYFVYYREVLENGAQANWTREHIKDTKTRQYKLPLRCRRQYEVGITVRNSFGESRITTVLEITTGSQGQWHYALSRIALLRLLLSLHLLSKSLSLSVSGTY